MQTENTTQSEEKEEKPDESGNVMIQELLRIYDPNTNKDFVVRKF
jgi:hypothetical protein